MKKICKPIWSKDEYTYQPAGTFIPNVRLYLHDQVETASRPLIFVVPGGGYRFVSPSEGENVALAFFNKGFDSAVLTYSTNVLVRSPLHLQPLRDLARAVRLLRHDAQELGINAGRIILCGFSAGAHLCGSLCVHYDDVTETETELEKISCRPDGAILCYPVISVGKYWHEGSFQALLGDAPSESELHYMSLEEQVTEKTPPCFIWHTVTDQTVPVENSLMFAQALLRHKVPAALHIFPAGPHGLSLADEQWAKGDFGDTYPMEQVMEVLRMVKSGEVPLDEAGKEALFSEFPDRPRVDDRPHPQVGMWFDLAVQWVRDFAEYGK